LAHRFGSKKMMRMKIPTVVTTISVLFLFAGSTAQADMMKFTAELTGAAQVPPTDSAAKVKIDVTLDTETKMVSWLVAGYEGDGKLSGEMTASHIHGPATATENAPPVIETTNGEEGSAPITDEQIADLISGLYYYNVHTEKFPGGEIRGQLVAAE